MLIVDIVDKYGGFKSMTSYLTTTHKRRLLWTISFHVFFSALLDNLAAAIVLLAVLKKLVPDRQTD